MYCQSLHNQVSCTYDNFQQFAVHITKACAEAADRNCPTGMQRCHRPVMLLHQSQVGISHLLQVWRYLCNKLLDGKQVSKEQHVEELSKLTIVAVDQVKAVLNDMKKDAKDKPEAAALLKQCLAQFGDTMVSMIGNQSCCSRMREDAGRCLGIHGNMITTTAHRV